MFRRFSRYVALIKVEAVSHDDGIVCGPSYRAIKGSFWIFRISDCLVPRWPRGVGRGSLKKEWQALAMKGHT